MGHFCKLIVVHLLWSVFLSTALAQGNKPEAGALVPEAPGALSQTKKKGAKGDAVGGTGVVSSQTNIPANKSTANKGDPTQLPKPQGIVVTLNVDRKILQIGEEARFTLEPANLVINPNFKFSINFGDGDVIDLDPGSNVLPHFYKNAKTYNVLAVMSPNYGNRFSLPTPVGVNVKSFTLRADPTTIEVGQQVVFQTDPVSGDPKIRYRFSFGDDSETDWQSESKTEHKYLSAGNGKYSATVHIGRVSDDGSVEELDKVPPKTIVVKIPKNPGPINNSNTKINKGWTQDWWVIVILILIAGLAGATTLFTARKLYKILFPELPTFRAVPDSGSSELESGTALTVDAQLLLNANTATGQFQLATAETNFIRSLRREHV